MPKKSRYTIYDMMEDKGIFDENTANSASPKYTGPVEFPRMMYHPEGKYKIMVPGEVISTPLGPKMVGQQTELISKTVENIGEQRALVAAGWHFTPAEAITANGGDAPATSPEMLLQRATDDKARLEMELEELRRQLNSQPNTVGAEVATKVTGEAGLLAPLTADQAGASAEKVHDAARRATGARA